MGRPPEAVGTTFQYEARNKRTVACAAGDNDGTALRGYVHKGEGIPLTLKNVNRLTGNQLADDKRTHLCAVWMVAPGPIFQPVMNCHYIARAIMNAKRDAAVVQADKSLLFEPGAKLE